MRNLTQLTFNFRFINRYGTTRHLWPKLGRLDENGLALDDHRICFQDIHKTEKHRDNLAIVLKPYASIGRNIQKHLIEGHTAIIISVADFAWELHAAIDNYCSQLQLEEYAAQLDEEQRVRYLKYVPCPNCNSRINVTGLNQTSYVFCPYCDVTFHRYQYQIPGGWRYRTCPECGYYNRVKDYEIVHAYFMGKADKHFAWRERYCCDACLHLYFEETIWKNLPLVFGSMMMLVQKWRSMQDRHPLYDGLNETVVQSRKGMLSEAAAGYDSLLLHNQGNPGLLYNYALLYLHQGQLDKAGYYLRRTLESCANYEPAIALLEKYSEEMGE